MRTPLMTMILVLLVQVIYAQYNNSITVQPVLKADTNAIGQKIVYPNVPDAEVTILKITMEPGKTTGWHKHEIPVFAYVLEGEITVEIDSNKTTVYKAGDAIAETRNVYHRGINYGTTNVVLLAFYIGEKNKKLAIPKE